MAPQIGLEQHAETFLHIVLHSMAVLRLGRGSSRQGMMHVGRVGEKQRIGNESHLMAVSEFSQGLDVTELGSLQAEAGGDCGESVLLSASAAIEEDDCEGMDGVSVAESSCSGE